MEKQFSADEFGILETTIIMFVIYFILMILGIIYSRLLIKKHMFHMTFKLFIVSVFAQFCSFLVTLCEYAQFSSSGLSTPGVLVIARLLDAIASTIFLFMLILIAKGYTVTRGRLRNVTKIKISILFLIYIIALVITFIYSEVVSIKYQP